jgi:hypothetical protein
MDSALPFANQLCAGLGNGTRRHIDCSRTSYLLCVARQLPCGRLAKPAMGLFLEPKCDAPDQQVPAQPRCWLDAEQSRPTLPKMLCFENRYSFNFGNKIVVSRHRVTLSRSYSGGRLSRSVQIRAVTSAAFLRFRREIHARYGLASPSPFAAPPSKLRSADLRAATPCPVWILCPRWTWSDALELISFALDLAERASCRPF